MFVALHFHHRETLTCVPRARFLPLRLVTRGYGYLSAKLHAKLLQVWLVLLQTSGSPDLTSATWRLTPASASVSGQSPHRVPGSGGRGLAGPGRGVTIAHSDRRHLTHRPASLQRLGHSHILVTSIITSIIASVTAPVTRGREGFTRPP